MVVWMTFSDFKVTMIQRQITRKWYNIELCLQWPTNRKSYMIYQTAPFSITLNDPSPGFWVMLFFDAIFQKHCSLVWSPSYVTLINKIEFVQRFFTKRLNGLFFFTFATYPGTRGHSLKLALPDSRINAISHSFAVRIVPVGNNLPNDAVTAANLYLFKNRLSKTNLAYALIGK